MFEHYLITRFNLKNPNWDVTKNNEELLTDEWMEDRMWLFENFCLPSVKAQSNKNFTWLLYLDTTTAEKYKTKITDLTSATENIKLFFINGMNEFYPEIQKATTSEKPYLITTRIDNDDVISKYFIDEVQKKFASQDFLAIDVIKGYSLQIKPIYILGKKEHVFNPFISLIEKNENPKTVWFNDHTQWKKESRIIQVTDKRLWMSIIHEKNKVNEFDGYDNVKWQDLKNEFIVSGELSNLISQEIIPYKDWFFLSLKNMLYVKMVFFSKQIKKSIGLYKIK
ncbi:glycosyltransferase [Flavobacterium limi]|uniref:Rhamnosyl transferase n=1 Tax=Flavobacterium limi TaxID=2045105 RepID=A0ABQ1UFX6_9FLAO|nr:glycosyltransferase [Flavobacterium limi]GGF17097.1 hypothetical protein GCM10011518_28130 [Flavobacterium limi]